MFISNHTIINTIVDSVYWADRKARSDLMYGYIVKEDDYTSNFTCNIRQQINALNIPTLKVHSQVNEPTTERATGTDAYMLISNGREYKVGYFEAKWPRYSQKSGMYPWDSTSRFSKQIKKQIRLSPNFAVWEMFYCEFPFGAQPANFPNHLSACVKHHHALNQLNSHSIVKWDNMLLDPLLNKHMTTIDKIVREMCLCSFGKPEKGVWTTFFEKNDIDKTSNWIVIEYNEEQPSIKFKPRQ